MKTKLYSLLTGLLMTACITSYGQEIVNEFTILKTDKDFWGCDLFENKDGTMIFRTLMYTPNLYIITFSLAYLSLHTPPSTLRASTSPNLGEEWLTLLCILAAPLS